MPHFLEGLTSEMMRRRMAERFAAEPANRVVHHLLGRERVLEWAHSVGVATDLGLAECVPPLPPRELREITAEVDPAMFLFTGIHDVLSFMSLYHQHAGSAPERPRVLDFGCGCGRLTRFFDPARWEVCASEVNPDHVAWCRANLPGVDTRANGPAPPLSFGSESFDLAYSLSILSHLSAAMIDAWLAELKRVTRPGGIVIVTYHGARVLELTMDSPAHQAALHLSPEDAREILDRLPRERIILLPYPAQEIDKIHVEARDYGNTFIDPAYALELPAKHELEPLACLTGGLRGSQDVLVLRRAL